MYRSCIAMIVLSFVVLTPAVSSADAGLLRTIQILDDARGYCLDIPGEGETLRLDAPLQAHTCKYGSTIDDQRFERGAGGAIRAPRYDRCLAAASLDAGARLVMQACASAPTQLWSMAWGRLSPASRPDLCISLAGEKGTPTGTPALISPAYRRRDVGLDRCDEAREGTQSFRWSKPDERGLSSAEITRNGMPADVAKQLAKVFRKLYKLRFPIRHMRVDDLYGPKRAQPADGDVSGSFVCREAVPSPCTGGTASGSWSNHAYGHAIDLNPIENPYVGCGRVHHPDSRPYVDRSRLRAGMVTPAVVRAFRSIGWGWGGNWSRTRDWMHFSASGR